MRKLLFALSLFGLQFMSAQENTDKIFNFGPMVRIHGIMPFNSGDNYLANSNKSKVSVGLNLSPFEVYGFRPYIGVDHIFYDTDNTEMAADVIRTKNTAVYGLLSYSIPIAGDFSAEPYVGGGWSGLTFKRSNNDDVFDAYDVDRQEGTEFRAGIYLDYKVASVISLFAGANYVRGSYTINTVPEYEDYFGKAQSVQINVGLKIGYTMNDKRKERAAQQSQTPK
jgi:hypothetical protein